MCPDYLGIRLLIIFWTAALCTSFICSGHSYCPPPCSLQRHPYDFCDSCHCPFGLENSLEEFKLVRCYSNKNCSSVDAICQHGFCLCNNQSVMIPHTKECVKAPTYDDPCLFGDRYAFKCQGEYFGVDARCVLNKSASNYGRCACKSGFRYDFSYGRCLPFPNNVYGNECTDNSTCTMAYSFCYKGHCICKREFKPSVKNLCEPKRKYCPSINGEATSPGDNCRVAFIDGISGKIVDNCTAGQFCFVYVDTENRRGGMVGHCCPIPPQSAHVSRACPQTTVAPYSCPFVIQDSVDLETPRFQRCPVDTHKCIPQPYRNDRACCQKPCPRSDAFVVDGQCYYRKSANDPCNQYPECPLNSKCSPDAKNAIGSWICKCDPGFQERNGECV